MLDRVIVTRGYKLLEDIEEDYQRARRTQVYSPAIYNPRYRTWIADWKTEVEKALSQHDAIRFRNTQVTDATARHGVNFEYEGLRKWLIALLNSADNLTEQLPSLAPVEPAVSHVDPRGLIGQLAELKAALANNSATDPFRHCFDLIIQIARATGSYFERGYPFASGWSNSPPRKWGHPFKVTLCELDDEHLFIELEIYAPDGGLLSGHTGRAPLTFLGDGTSLEDDSDEAEADPLGWGDSLLHAARMACDRWMAVLSSGVKDYGRSEVPRANDAPAKTTDNNMAATGELNSRPEPGPGDIVQRLLRLYAGNVADDRISRAADVLSSDKTADEKLAGLDRELKIPPTVSAEKLGELLGKTKQAVMKTKWWSDNRRGAKDEIIAERQDRLRKRGQRLDNATE